MGHDQVPRLPSPWPSLRFSRMAQGAREGHPGRCRPPVPPTVPGFPLQWALALASEARDPPGPCRMARLLLEPR